MTTLLVYSMNGAALPQARRRVCVDTIHATDNNPDLIQQCRPLVQLSMVHGQSDSWSYVGTHCFASRKSSIWSDRNSRSLSEVKYRRKASTPDSSLLAYVWKLLTWTSSGCITIALSPCAAVRCLLI